MMKTMLPVGFSTRRHSVTVHFRHLASEAFNRVSELPCPEPGRPAEFTRRPPRWDGTTLWCDGIEVRTLQRPAENVRAVLGKFQQTG